MSSTYRWKKRKKIRLLPRENFNECCDKRAKRSARTALYDLGYVNAGIVVDISRVIVPSGDGKAEPGGALWEKQGEKTAWWGQNAKCSSLVSLLCVSNRVDQFSPKKIWHTNLPQPAAPRTENRYMIRDPFSCSFFSLLLLYKIAPGRYKT